MLSVSVPVTHHSCALQAGVCHDHARSAESTWYRYSEKSWSFKLSFCFFLLISHFSLVLTVFHYSHFGGCVGVSIVVLMCVSLMRTNAVENLLLCVNWVS